MLCVWIPLEAELVLWNIHLSTCTPNGLIKCQTSSGAWLVVDGGVWQCHWFFVRERNCVCKSYFVRFNETYCGQVEFEYELNFPGFSWQNKAELEEVIAQVDFEYELNVPGFSWQNKSELEEVMAQVVVVVGILTLGFCAQNAAELIGVMGQLKFILGTG